MVLDRLTSFLQRKASRDARPNIEKVVESAALSLLCYGFGKETTEEEALRLGDVFVNEQGHWEFKRFYTSSRLGHPIDKISIDIIVQKANEINNRKRGGDE